MWHTILVVMSILWVIASIFLIYAVSNAFVAFDWKMPIIAILLWVVVTAATVAAGIIAE